MSVNSEVNNFEQVLMDYSTGKSLLYRDKIIKETSVGIKSIDIINNVSKQIKYINSNETSTRSSGCKLKALKKCNMVPVSMLTHEPQQKTGTLNNSETQLLFDTQLLTVIKDAEAAKDTREGVTQEFDITFEQSIGSKLTSENMFTNNNNMESICLKTLSSNTSGCSDLRQTFLSECKCNEDTRNDKERNEKSKFDDNHPIEGIKSNYNLFKKGMPIPKYEDGLDELNAFTVQIFNTQVSGENSLSPMLNSNKYKKTRQRCSMTCRLESFEKFEDIAGPIVRKNSNQKVVKEIINSCIINNAFILHKQDHTQDLVHKNLKLFQFNSLKNANDAEPKEDILFSSDEESDYIQNQITDLPLTSALETTFYKEEDILNKSMYVGFQTASNKSIQVLTNSFSKAKHILNDLNDDSKKPSIHLTVTELIKEYDCTSKETEDGTGNMKNISLLSKEGECEHKVEQDKKISASDIHAGCKCSRNTLSNSSDDTCSKSKVTWDDNDEDAYKVQANFSTKVAVTHFSENHEIINHNVRTLPNVASTSHLKTFQEEINIDECLIKEFENSLLCLYDNKLHTNSKNSYPCNATSDYQSSELTNITKSFLKPICGFTTASKKPISITDKGITKMQNIFDDIDIDSVNNPIEAKTILDQNNIACKIDKAETQKELFEYIESDCKSDDVNKLPLFTKDVTCYDKKIMRENYIRTQKKSENILDKVLENSYQNNKNDNYKEKQANNFICESMLLQGFKTASNKPVAISEKALVQSNKILQEFDIEHNLIDSDMYNAECSRLFPKDITHSDNQLVKEYVTTGTTNHDNIPAESLLKTKLILDFDKPLYNNVDNCKEKGRNVFLKESKLFQGFRTASNKPVVISEKALEKSNRILQELDFQVDQRDKDVENAIGCKKITESLRQDSKCTGKEENCVKESIFFHGFRTASNKPVIISQDALAKSNMILQDLKYESNHKGDVIDEENEDNNVAKESNLFQGFKTAANRPVIISNKALAESNKKLQEFHCESNFVDNYMKVKCNKQSTSDITGRNLVHSKRMLDFVESFDGYTGKKHDKINEQSTFFSGECPATSNKRIKFSDVVLPQSEVSESHISLQDHDNTASSEKYCKDSNMGPPFSKKCFQGFKSANNNQVKVSKEAIARSKKIFQDLNNHPDNLTKIKKTNHIVMGFQTANNKTAIVSEEAFQKSKKIFEDIDDNLKMGIKQKLKSDYMHRQIVTFKTPISNNISKRYDTIKLMSNTYKDTAKSKHLVTTDIDNIMNTEIIRDFEETLHTEDFMKKSPLAKRPGSPIISCPKAKRINISPTTNKKNVEKDQNIAKFLFNKNYKKVKQFKLLDICEIEKESKQIESSHGIHFDMDNILDFELVDRRHGLSNIRWSTYDIKKYFLDSVNKKIIPEGWVENHIKLILLKLISYEKRFPNVMAGICSINNIMDQLKYRYQRELYNVERPALRKILEKDEVPCRRLVLSVLNIYIDGITVTKSSVSLSENIELQVSDGWYCVKATIDKMLLKFVKEGKIVIGTKLITQGAELLNCEQGIAPWENTSFIRLKIFGNSTRRAHWTSRLGFHDNSVPFVSFLTAVKPEGGKISQLRVVVTRVYPMLYVEKFDDGSTVTRSERLENLHQTRHETERETLLEKVYEEVEKEFANQDSQDHESLDVEAKNLESGSQIYHLMKKSRDPSEFRTNLSHSQAQLLQEYTIKRRELSIQELQTKVEDLVKKRRLNVVRNVVPMLKIRVADVYKNNVTKAVITIWRPNESLLHLLKEGTWVDIFNVVPTAVRYSEIQISAGKQSVFRKAVNVQNQKKNIVRSLERKCFTIHELTNNPYLNTDYNEVDTVGFVFDIKPSFKEFDSKNNHFQNVFLADVNKKIICVNFWGGLRKFGFENILEIGQIVACVNLQKRLGNTRKNIPQYRATEFSYFTKTPKLETIRQLFDDLSKQLLSLDRRQFIQDCNILRNDFDIIKHGNTENISPYRFNNSDYNISKNKTFIDSPVGNTNLNLNWVDFESSFKHSETVSPKTILRKKEVSEKIARLKKYGEPPPLNSIHIVNKNADAALPYKCPLLSKHESNPTNPSNSKINNTEVKIVSNIQTSPTATNPNASSGLASSRCTSPVLPCTCRTVNPVKLNFSKKEMTKDDPYGEDFESSPPLSLD